jgi:uncharacterized protein (DUF1778 family)
MRRNEQICARVTADEMAALRSMAEKESRLLSQFIRQTLAEKVASLTTSPGAGSRLAGIPSHRQQN